MTGMAIYDCTDICKLPCFCTAPCKQCTRSMQN